jgi:hypothetical protein
LPFSERYLTRIFAAENYNVTYEIHKKEIKSGCVDLNRVNGREHKSDVSETSARSDTIIMSYSIF